MTSGCQTTHDVFFKPDPVAKCAASPLPPIEIKLAAMLDAPNLPSGWPVDAPERKVISNYGFRGKHMHRGVDIKADYATPVYATARGTVVFSGIMSGYGNLVVVDHGNGYETAYAHLKDRAVDVSESVKRGDSVGHMGRTGRATTQHVHYEVRRAGESVNPMPFIQGNTMAPEWREFAAKTP